MRPIYLAVLILLVTASPIDSQQAPLPAITKCVKGKPVTFIDSTIPPYSPYWNELMVHEMVHVKQLKPDGNYTCDQKFAQITKDARSFLEAEAEATCAQLTYAWRRDKTLDYISLRKKAMYMLYTGFKQEIELMEIWDILTKYCIIRYRA